MTKNYSENQHNLKDDDITNSTIDFGYQQVPTEKKQGLVETVFRSVANRYDIMNDLMSLGIHRYWKKYTAAIARIKPGDYILDIAGGTADMTRYFAKDTGDAGKVVLADINDSMLQLGRDKIINAGLANNVNCIQANAECLPFANNSFDLACIAFGLRNVTNKQQALDSLFRVLKPGGRLIILEFSKPTSKLLSKIYDTYSFNILPEIGKFVANDKPSYQYLAESIRMHPNQQILANMLEKTGFKTVNYQNLTGGIVAIHTGLKAD
jgi:demethylmenaquinone methyltransferase/2-methoxy-6-polyprenyl-1,4-benzoquinol methylase